MTYKLISTIIINLLATIYPQYQEIGLISQLNDFFNFDHNIFLLDSSAEVNRFMPRQRDYTPQSLYFFKSVDDNFSFLETVKEIKSKNTFLIVVPEGSSNLISNLYLLNHIKQIRRLQISMKIGIFFSQFVSSDDLHELFEWCWKQRIINIFAAIYSYPGISTDSSFKQFLNIFTFNPFGEFNVVNVTGSESFDNFFLSRKANFQQHPIRTAVLDNTWSLQTNDSLNYELANEKVWKSVFRVLNASFVTIQVNYNMDPIEIDAFDIFAYLYQNKEDEPVKIYPMTMTAHSLVVPEALPYREFAAYLRTVTSDIFFGYTLVTILAVMILLSIFRYIRLKKIIFFQSACDVLNLLMNDNGDIKYQQLSRIEVFLIVPLTLAGFVIVTSILSALQSFLTQPIMQPQIDTVEDIYRSSFPILTWDEYWASRLITALENLSKHRDWRDKVHVAGYRELYRLITSYNTTISFCWEEPRAKVLLHLQKRFNIRGYHLSQTRTFSALDSYPVNDYFPFIGRINEIIDWMRNAGLYEKWRQEEYSEIMKDVLENRDNILVKSEETDIDRFPLPMFILYGWVAGLIILLMEIIYNHFRSTMIVSNI